MRNLLKVAFVLAIFLPAAPAFAQDMTLLDPGPTGLATTFFPPSIWQVYPHGYYRPVATGFPFPEEPVVVEQPVVVAAPAGGVAYCEQRFRSYDPQSGTYLGYDGMRHPCP